LRAVGCPHLSPFGAVHTSPPPLPRAVFFFFPAPPVEQRCVFPWLSRRLSVFWYHLPTPHHLEDNRAWRLPPPHPLVGVTCANRSRLKRRPQLTPVKRNSRLPLTFVSPSPLRALPPCSYQEGSVPRANGTKQNGACFRPSVEPFSFFPPGGTGQLLVWFLKSPRCGDQFCFSGLYKGSPFSLFVFCISIDFVQHLRRGPTSAE